MFSSISFQSIIPFNTFIIYNIIYRFCFSCRRRSCRIYWSNMCSRNIRSYWSIRKCWFNCRIRSTRIYRLYFTINNCSYKCIPIRACSLFSRLCRFYSTTINCTCRCIPIIPYRLISRVSNSYSATINCISLTKSRFISFCCCFTCLSSTSSSCLTSSNSSFSFYITTY